MITLKAGLGGLIIRFDVEIKGNVDYFDVVIHRNTLTKELTVNVPATGGFPLEAMQKLQRVLLIVEVIIENDGLKIEESALTIKWN